jgi:hypothetical protein
MYGIANGENDPLTVVYKVRQYLSLKVRTNRLNDSESDFLEEELFPVMDRFIDLCQENIEIYEAANNG